MTESYEDAIKIIMREHRVDEPTAALMVADVYPALAAFDATSQPDIAFDPVDADSVGLVYHKPSPAGRPVPVDDDRSPAGAIFAQAERLEAKRNGDRYRSMGRRTSMHEIDGGL